MQLYDKDLLSVQEVRELVEKAKAAQKELSQKSQREVDAIVRSIAEAGGATRRRSGKTARPRKGDAVEVSEENKKRN